MASANDLQHAATNLYYDRVQELEAVKILPGEYYVTNKDMLLVTVVGAFWITRS